MTYADGSTVVLPPRHFAPADQQGETRKARYRDYLYSPVWKERKEAALRRAHHKCQRCGGTKRLQVHHPHYNRVGNEAARELIVLCRSCHAAEHGRPE